MWSRAEARLLIVYQQSDSQVINDVGQAVCGEGGKAKIIIHKILESAGSQIQALEVSVSGGLPVFGSP